VPAAGATLRRLEKAGYRTVIATNNSTRHRRDVASGISKILGVTIDADRIVTSGLAVVTMLDADARPILVVGEDGLRETLTDAGITLTTDPEEAKVVVVGLDRSFDYRRMAAAAAAIVSGARFVATNGDATFPTGGIPEPGAGAIVAAIERASGVAPVYAGKPNEPMLRAISRLLGPGPTWIVGDRLDTDMALGKRAAWTSVLVMTGVTESRGDIPPAVMPDHIIDSVADLPRLLAVDDRPSTQ
jgi:4-nitrophenyl phosphatase